MRRARHHRAVKSNRDTTLAHVECLLFDERGERCGGERFALYDVARPRRFAMPIAGVPPRAILGIGVRRALVALF